MIFYFSGTGNSKYAAKYLAEKTGDKLVKISDQLNNDSCHFALTEGERVGFVFPIYGWLSPKIVSEFISKITFANIPANVYAYSVITCGSDVGKAFKVLDKALLKRGLKLNAKASVAMPDNYVVMFETNSPQEIAEKMEKADNKLSALATRISAKDNFEDIEYKSMSGFKTYVIGPFFHKFLINPKKFYAEKTCTKCGLCEKICPTKTIKITDAPTWGKKCTACLACLHRCPVKAIQYGKSTKNKGRYYFDKDVKLIK